MPAARKPASRTTTAPKRTTAAEPAALKRLNKALDDAQKALVALRKDVGKDVSRGARDLSDDLAKFIKDARRDSGKLGTALQKDLKALQKRLANPKSRPPGRDLPRGDQRPPSAPTPQGATRRAQLTARPVAGSHRHPRRSHRSATARSPKRSAGDPAPPPVALRREGSLLCQGRVAVWGFLGGTEAVAVRGGSVAGFGGAVGRGWVVQGRQRA